MKKTHEKSRIYTVTGTAKLKNPENVVLQIEATGQRNGDGFIYLVESVAAEDYNSYVFQNVGIEKIIQRRIQRRRPYSRTHDRSGRRRSGRLLYFFRLVGDLVQQLDIPERSEGGNY